MTVRELITNALLHISAIGQGQTPNGSEMANGFAQLNTMILGWNSARENVFSLTELQLGLINGVQSYTMGPGGSLSGIRPVAIQNAAFRISGTTVVLRMNLLTAREWNGIPDREASGNVLEDVYYDYAFPVATIQVNPVPIGAPILLLMAWIPFTSFADIDAPVSLPDAYPQALEYGLAIRMASWYGIQAPPEKVQMAMQFKADMQRFNQEHVFGITKQETIPTVGVPQGAPPSAPTAQ